MLPGNPETVKKNEILHGNIYILQHTAQHIRNTFTPPYTEHSVMLEVSECQRKNT